MSPTLTVPASTPQNPRSPDATANANANTDTTLTGTCPCGSISITVQASDPSLRNDQDNSKNANALTIDADKTAIQDRRSTLKMYFDLEMMSGRQIEKFFCSSCGSPVMSMTALLPGRVNLTMGLAPRVPESGFENRQTALRPPALPRHSQSGKGKLDDAVQWSTKANAGVA
ncbi:uncharacterized protein DSM5745_02329 [Aspergillus mulundensis]|uniref:CENP-V/GFA domain-containing protein n=1 Tax=Aspergillus mulundensis TaxID=1810919 RepID=A0A3D8SW99_9EURO|nr:Uncharacterized protein DSM5745_02329 [Aspergillus mulundensis]RDW90554.1 Uncharacterized protein DSM5745_02329 [Aspergillus mulundensis]